MWASVQRIRVQNGADDGDVARRISEELVPALLEDAGASRCWWALDPSSRVVLGVTLWSDQTAYFEGRGSAARIRAGALDPLGAHPLVAHSVEHSPAKSEEHTSELQSLMRSSYAVFCSKKKKDM